MLRDSSPLTGSFVDSSFSRTYLTSSNNSYQQIHATTNDPKVLAERRRRNESLAQKRLSPSRRSHRPPLLKTVRPYSCPQGKGSSSAGLVERSTEVAMATTPTEAEIHALPESSDEEGAQENESKPNSEPQRQQSPKRPRQEVASNRRSKRRKKDGVQGTLSKGSEMQETSNPTQESLPDFLSQSSQSKRRNRYGGSAQKSWQAPPPTNDAATPHKKANRSSIEFVGSSPLAPRMETAPIRLPGTLQQVKGPSFVVPGGLDDEDDELEPSTNSTTLSNNRRGSTSSLSSVDSLSEHQLDAAWKKRLMTDAVDSGLLTTLPKGYFFCLICKNMSSLDGLDLPFHHKPKSKKNNVSAHDLQKLPIRKLQSLCRAHRIRDAQNTWIQRDYPTTTPETWSALPDRVSKHISHISSVLRRKKASFYLTHLDDAITSARGNQKAINTYFNTTALSLIHYGYYGPKGSKIVGQSLLGDKTLEKILGKHNKSDKNMRVAGVGRLVESVLVPEVLMRLVGEDMGVQDEQARKILGDSADLGVLLCGDDDEIAVPEEYEDEDKE